MSPQYAVGGASDKEIAFRHRWHVTSVPIYLQKCFDGVDTIMALAISGAIRSCYNCCSNFLLTLDHLVSVPKTVSYFVLFCFLLTKEYFHSTTVCAQTSHRHKKPLADKQKPLGPFGAFPPRYSPAKPIQARKPWTIFHFHISIPPEFRNLPSTKIIPGSIRDSMSLM